jgi:hypothetical protein
MTIPRILLVVGAAAVFYLLGANREQLRTGQIVRSARAAWKNPEEKKKDRKRLQKIAKRNAKKVTKGIYR